MPTPVRMLLPGGQAVGQCQGPSGAAYSPDAMNTISVSDPRDIMGFLGSGYLLCEIPQLLCTFGGGTGTFFDEGNLNRQVGNPVAQPAGTAADYVLASYALPANSFDVSGRGLALTASGSFGATVNTKQVKLWWNATIGAGQVTAGTLIADSGASVGNGVGWVLTGNVFKYGATGSNTQYCQATGIVVGATHLGLNVPQFAAAAENGIINVAVTGKATTVVTDISLAFWEVNAMN